MKNLTLYFGNVEQVHLGKDVFLTPYYLSKHYNLSCSIVFPKTKTNIYLPKEYRNIKLKHIGNKITTFFLPVLGELCFYFYLLRHARTIDYLMLFHITPYTCFRSLFYKFLNPKGKIYVKMDMNYSASGFINQTPESIKNKIYHKVLKLFFESVDLLSVETVYMYTELKHNNLFNPILINKLEYLSNCIDIEYLSKNIKRKEYYEKENIIITVGRIGTVPKNSELLLDALCNFNLGKWKVLFIGPVENSFLKKYQKKIQEKRISSTQVILTGNIAEKQQLFDYYNKAKVFVFTSDWESFGLVLTEALYFGDYIITTDVGAARDVTNNDKIGSVIPTGDITSLKNKLSEVIEDKIDLSEKYTESVNLVNNSFIYEKYFQKLSKFNTLFKE